MYRCFNLTVQNGDFFDQPKEYIDECKRIGQTIKDSLQVKVNEILSAVTNPDGVIDGANLAETWFPVECRDVFLSYSHNDEELAFIVAGILNKSFGLSVFMDALAWGSADDLLKGIDDRFCKKSNGSYSYEKRNFSTSHVHSMLTAAIMRAMDQTEVVLFLNTNNSTYQLAKGFENKHTLSPWIFEEIMLSTVLRRRDWKEHRKEPTTVLAHYQEKLDVVYPLCLDSFTHISTSDVVEWKQKWEERKSNIESPYGGMLLPTQEKIIHSLNVLYEMKFGVNVRG